jgi:hypothetical protein
MIEINEQTTTKVEYPKIYGQQRFRQDQIGKILAVTGLTYEEAFREEYA